MFYLYYIILSPLRASDILRSMNIFFSGIGGVGIGPLAEIAHDAGHAVTGSDLADSLVTQELRERGIEVSIGQDGSFLKACHEATPLDWFVYTAALPDTHPELLLAKELGIRTGKRDEFLAEFIKEHDLKLIAISGTHGKTTTTGMAVWALKQLGIPVSYSVGTTLSFGPSGAYDPASKYFVYECDEYDRNFLHFSPALSLLTSIDYDHPDTYPTEADYTAAFRQYIQQSAHTIAWQKDLDYVSLTPDASIWSLNTSETAPLQLAGAHNRRNATLVLKALEYLGIGDEAARTTALESFPGTDRRFEKLGVNLYTDYGHHPEEITATLQLAKELSDKVALVYQPHQNVRQHEVRHLYTDEAFKDADTIYWLPTYLTREDPEKALLSPKELTEAIRSEKVHITGLTEETWDTISGLRSQGYLVLCMGAGTIDAWVRQQSI
jgi:UDP-N-acetylmuramate--alanine ligase